MDRSVLEFLSANRISVLSVIQSDNTSHSSTMHYSHSDNPFKLYFSTDIKSKKCQSLQNGQSANASVAIGFSEIDWLTLQLSGSIRIITDDENLSPLTIASIKSVHYTKHPTSAKYAADPGTVFLEFTPSWWRFTDFTKHPPLIIES